MFIFIEKLLEPLLECVFLLILCSLRESPNKQRIDKFSAFLAELLVLRFRLAITEWNSEEICFVKSTKCTHLQHRNQYRISCKHK